MNTTEKDVTDKLILIFQIVSDWLKYAETKNSILLAFSGASITAIITYIATAKSSFEIQIGLFITLFLLFISSILTSFSFLPNTNLEKIQWLKSKPSNENKTCVKETDNFYYFQDLRKYKAYELIDSLNRLYFDNKITNINTKEYIDIANQIILNSEIAFMKFRLSGISSWSLMIAILFTMLTIIFDFFRH